MEFLKKKKNFFFLLISYSKCYINIYINNIIIISLSLLQEMKKKNFFFIS